MRQARRPSIATGRRSTLTVKPALQDYAHDGPGELLILTRQLVAIVLRDRDIATIERCAFLAFRRSSVG
jgi:hypothetical protein